MATIEEIINMWLNVQNMWMYMEAVFSGGDIVKQLPSEAKRFKNIDKQFVKMAKVAADVQNVVEVCCDSKMMMEVLPVLLSSSSCARRPPLPSWTPSGHVPPAFCL